MMHDALRADVMSALFATTAAQRTAYAVDEVTDHGTTLVNDYDAAAALAPAGLRGAYAQGRTKLVQYAQTAETLVSTAASDHAAAVGQLTAYLAIYHQLEDELSALDDAMMA